MTFPTRLAPLALWFAILTVPAAAVAGPHKGVVGKMTPAAPVLVSGKLLTYQGQPAGNRQIHLENTVSGDSFLTQTGNDGSFSIALPPAGYNLREEHGPIVARNIPHWVDDVNLGSVSEPGTWWQRLLESEGVAPAVVHSPAPITSNVRPGQPIELNHQSSSRYSPQ